MTRRLRSGIALGLAASLILSACGGDDNADNDTGGTTGGGSSTDTPADLDYAALGLWDDGACDESKPPLIVGTQTVFESPVISLGDVAVALEAAGEAFNKRGGVNGSCIQVITCDDKANLDAAVNCARDLDDKGVQVVVNDLVTAGASEVAGVLSGAGIPRVATNLTPGNYDDDMAFPLNASSSGAVFLLPKGLVESGINKIGILRPDLSESAIMQSLFEQVYGADGAEFVSDAPVASGTTDYTQYILSASDAGAEGVVIATGEQEAVQLVKAGQQLATDLKFGISLGTFSHKNVTDLGDTAEQMVFVGAFPPATMDVPVYEVLRADLAASGDDRLQPDTLKTSAQQSWIGLYATIKMLRDANVTDFSRENVTAAIRAAKDVPMLGIFGDETWTPDVQIEGLFARPGIPTWGIYSWNPDAEAPDGLSGNFEETTTVDFVDILCGTPLGAPAETC